MFVTRDLPQSLSGPDLLPALHWATEFGRTATHTGEFHTKQLADAILIKAWEYIDNPDILNAFIDYITLIMRRLHRIYLREHENSAEDRIRHNGAKRRQFLLGLLKTQEPLQPADGYLMRKTFLEVSDLEWLLSVSPSGSAPIAGINPQSLWALIEAVFNPWEPSQFEAFYDIAMRWPLLHQRYDHLLDGVALDSSRARDMRQYHELEQKGADRRP
jgi:hypothetical protein